MIHTFDTKDAERYGILEAVIISNFKFWIANNKANQRNQFDGRTWTYNSVQALAELFPYASIGQVRRAIEKLVEAGILVKGCYNESPYDRTAWYAFADENCQLDLANSAIDLANLTNVHLANSANVYKETDSKQQIVNTDSKPIAATASPRKAGRPSGEQAKTNGDVWNAYADAYSQRYGVDPVRNAKVNSMIKQVVDRIGKDAVHVAAFYVQHNEFQYIRSTHSVNLLLRDCESLRTQWATNMQVTTSKARSLDRMGDTAARVGNVTFDNTREWGNGN